MSACSASECDRPARGLFCEAHWKRKQRGKPMDVPLRARAPEQAERLAEAVLAFRDAESDEDFRLASGRMTRAAIAYAVARGYRLPSPLDKPSASKPGV